MYVRTLTMTENYSPNCVIDMKKLLCLDMVRITTVNVIGVKYIPQKLKCEAVSAWVQNWKKHR